MDESSGWAAAADLAAGGSGPNAGRLRRRRVALLVVIIVVAAVVGVGAALGGSLDGLAAIPRAPDGRVWTALTLEAVAVVLFVAGVVFASRSRTRGSGMPRQSILAPLSRAERASAWRQLAGRESVDPEHRRILEAAAEQIDRTGAMTVAIGLAFPLLYVGMALVARSWVLVGLLSLAFVILVFAYGLAGRRYLIVRAFLRRSSAERSAP